MEIEIIKTDKPFFKSFTLCAVLDREKLKKDKQVTVEVNSHTKTRLSTSLQFGEACYKINHKIDGYNLHEESEHSYFTGNYSTSHYYKLSKKQNMEVYERYLKDLLTHIFRNVLKIELDTLKVNFINYVKK